MSATRRLAISYSRFSDPKQAGGDSEDRQDRLFRDFCTRHNLTPLSEVYADRGRSGYHDEHRRKGRLGQLIALAKAGRLEPGTVIVIEAWDRLGRLRPDRQTELVAELLRTGVNLGIGVCRLDDVFTEEDFGTHKWTTLAVFIQLAYQESKQKAERVAESWAKRREVARASIAQGEAPATLRGVRPPAWITVVKGEARLIPARVAAVKRIFALAAIGYGHSKIAARLHAEGHVPFGEVVVRERRSRSQFSGRWNRPYIRLILNDRRALGEMQLMKGDVPDGPPLAGFYPPCVGEDEFLLARDAQSARCGKGSRRGARKYVNVFRSLLRHARDGEGFVLHNKGTAAAPELVLINASGEGGRERCWTFPYAVMETAVLGLLKEVDPKDILPRETASKADVLRASLSAIRADIAGLRDELKAAFSRGLASVLREKEAQEEEAADRLQAELARTVRPAAQAWGELPTLTALVATSPDPEEVRLRISNALRRAVECIHVLIVSRGWYRLAALDVVFAGEGRRAYLICYQPGNRHHKARWWASSILDAGPLDLRKPDRAAALAEELEALDLATLTAL